MPDNLRSTLPHHDIIEEYIKEELDLGRFSGPYTQEELESILQGPFCSSPLQIVTKPGPPGAPPKHRVCINLSFTGESGSSINDHIDSDEYPTRWGGPKACAHLVQPFFFSLLGVQQRDIGLSTFTDHSPTMLEAKG